jgi:Ca2+:H+ antiporter
MAGHDLSWKQMPWWCWAGPAAAIALFAFKTAGLVSPGSFLFLGLATLFLGAAVFAAVHHAEILAVKIGEPFGSVILALAITIIEVGLIVSVMASGSSGAETVARDTVYSAVMIVLNGIVGLCLVVGGARHHEQDFQPKGAAAILSVIATLAILALVLPNFTLTTPGPLYAPKQLIFIGTVSLALYFTFVFIQTVRHRDYFIIGDTEDEHIEKPDSMTTLISAGLLVVSLIGVILLAKALSPSIEGAVKGAGLPLTVVGIVIASVVLLPEAMASLKAASRNRLQASMNAALGSALASIGLTIPAVAAVSIYLNQKLILGLGPEEMVLLLLTLFISTLTFATGRTTVMQGAVHLVIFGVFLFLSAFP